MADDLVGFIVRPDGAPMALRYISTKSAVFHPDATTGSQEFVLLFGDEVDTTGPQANGRTEVEYRHRTGWVDSQKLMTQHPLELYFIDVGQGDATFIVTPAGRKILIDGGKGNEAFQFLVWKYRLDLPDAQPVTIDLMVVSHTDEDHLGGLISIVEHDLIQVAEIVHSGIAKFSAGFDTELGDTEGAHPNRFLVTRHDAIDDLDGLSLTQTMGDWRDAVVAEPNLVYRAVDATSPPIDVGDPAVALHVLGPRLVDSPNHSDVFAWLSGAARTVNGHSVVLRLDCGPTRILLPGDLNDRGARHLLADPAFAAEADAHVFKSPHHGSHEFERDFLDAVQPQVSVVSSGEDFTHGHPRANFLGTIGKASRSEEPLLFSTELVANFAVDHDAEAPDADDEVDPTNAALLGQARRRFKKRLNGLINVRVSLDGQTLHCARRVSAGYQFVTYELPIAGRD